MSEKITLNIHDIICAACVRRVESAPASVDGLTKVSVNFATRGTN